MGKGKGLTFTVFAALGAIAGYATYMARKDEFSDETKDTYEVFINKARNVGTDIKRTYTSIGNKKQFTNNTKNLKESATKLASEVGTLVKSATSDIYQHAKSQVSEKIDSSKNKTNVSSNKNQKSKQKVLKKQNNNKKKK